MNELNLLLKTIHFSAQKHRDQRRKGATQAPYINHPLEVAHLLSEVGKIDDVEILMAAILHDTIEDTKTTAEEIESLFGKNVLGYVLEVTDDKSLEKFERKRLQVENAPHKSPQAKAIKLADKICNVRDIVLAPPANWTVERQREYLLWTEKVVHGVRGTNSALEALYDKVLAEGKQALNIQ
jgi:guanosine-3',5'-bis(diphosphate) 3'-pyrophosphohydrolase